MYIRKRCFLVLAILLIISLGCFANPVTSYTNPAAFNAAAHINNTGNFNGIVVPIPPGRIFYGNTGPTISGVSFTTSDLLPNGIYAVNTGFGSDLLSCCFGTLMVTLPSAATAIYFDISTFGFVSFDFNNGTRSGDYFGSHFIGFTAATPFTALTIDYRFGNIAGELEIQDFGTGSANNAVPEPSSLALGLTGLLGVAGALRRRAG